MMNQGCLLPRSVGRQLAGTVREQLAHLTCDVARMTAAAAISGDGFQGADKLVLAVLQERFTQAIGLLKKAPGAKKSLFSSGNSLLCICGA